MKFMKTLDIITEISWVIVGWDGQDGVAMGRMGISELLQPILTDTIMMVGGMGMPQKNCDVSDQQTTQNHYRKLPDYFVRILTEKLGLKMLWI